MPENNLAKALSMISLAKKAGKVLTGSDVCEAGLKSLKIKLLIVSEDASDNTKKNFNDMCLFRKIPINIYFSRQELGKFTGKDEIVVLGITDDGFAEVVTRLLNQS